MSTKKGANAGASLHAKLRNYATATGVPMDTALRRYAQERLIQLVSVSRHADDFCLKGGVLMAALNDGHHLRPTEDIDFNGLDPDGDVDLIEEVMKDICGSHDGSDGMTIDIDTLKVLHDRDGIVPGGKVSLHARIGTARVQLKVDVGFGNIITPHTRKMEIPTILPAVLPPPTISVYPLETVIAEKFHAMVRHGLINTRMKDYLDIYRLSSEFGFDGENLSSAIRNTFEQHHDAIPLEPRALSVEFEEHARRSWNQFRLRTTVDRDVEFSDVLDRIREFLLPAAEAANGGPVPGDWEPGNGWVGGCVPGMR